MKLSFTTTVLATTALSLFIVTPSFAYHHKGVYKDMPTSNYLHDGLYVGAQAGYDVYTVRHNIGFLDPDGDSFAQNAMLTPKGWMGGVFLGFGKYINNELYLGGEGTYNGVSANNSYTLNATTSGSDTDTITTKVTANTSYGLAFLPGMRINDYTLGYIRLGYNWTRFKAQETFTGDSTTLAYSKSKTLGGFNYGLGAEMLVHRNWSVRGEYSYTNYNSFTTSIGSRISAADSKFLVGVVYHFV